MKYKIPKTSKKRLEYQHNRQANRKAQGLCVSCGIPISFEDKTARHSLCSECRRKVREADSTRIRQRREQKLCLVCGKQSVVGNRNCLCEDCWFRSTTKNRTGSFKDWLAIKELLQRQQYLCAYTGKKLIIGQNASLDHIIPKAKGGDNSIDNFQWVDIRINAMKNNMSHEEFISIIRLILTSST